MRPKALCLACVPEGIRPLIPQISPGALGVRGLTMLSSVEEFSVLSLDVIVNDGF